MVVVPGTQPFRPNVAFAKSAQRSKIANGKLLPGIDQRSTWVRRAKELVTDYTSDLGGIDNISTGEAALIRRAAIISVECEQLELKFALKGDQPADAAEIQTYLAASNCLRRLLESIGLKRRPRDVSTPSLSDVLRSDVLRVSS